MLPLGDVQFWLVTCAAAAALGFALRRLRRTMRGTAPVACIRCPLAARGALPVRRHPGGLPR